MKQSLIFALLTLSLTACTTTTLPPKQPLSTPAKPNTPPNIALVLGGGGAKGFSHIGVIKVLEQNGIKPDLIVGTSSGSIVGSLYASGKSAKQIEAIAIHVSASDLLDVTFSKQGMIEGVKLQNWVNDQVGNRNIEQLPIRFAAIATNLSTPDTQAQKAVFTTGDTGLAVRASSSVKGVFIAPRINNQRYADGSLTSLVPVQTAKDLGAKVVIAVDLTAPPPEQTHQPLDFWALIDKSFAVMPHKPGAELALANVIIRPEVGHIGSTDTVNREAIIQAGETATWAKLADIKAAIKTVQ